MKILLRMYDDAEYVWKTAKYRNGHFYVNGNLCGESNIVSVINDNRKKYIQCSSCGKIFRKNDPKFEIHKQNAENPSTCLDCPHLYINTGRTTKQKFVINPDGSQVEKIEREVFLE